MTTFSPGSLVRARGREWVVLPDSSPDLLLLQPLGGASSDVTGIFAPRFQNQTFTFKPQGVTFLAGGNNSGKSTLLHALSLWEFCRTVVEQEKNRDALLTGANIGGIGISAEDFSPLALPSLKHLWHNLKPNGSGSAPSYNLKVRCAWPNPNTAPGIVTGDASGSIVSGSSASLHLEFALLLTGDRLYLKPSSSNLRSDSPIPHVAYLPTFAGIAPVEERLSMAARKRLIGLGVAGAVLRNTIYDLWHESQRQREGLKNVSGRIPAKTLSDFRHDDPWERLLETVQDVFKVGITVEEFNAELHTRLRVALYPGALQNKRFKKAKGVAERDVMVEGSGFLQWLSVYALVVRDDLEVLLLDEPDAHLHPSLQGYLTERLRRLAIERHKQVLLATHSTTILSEAKLDDIFRVEKDGYLSKEEERVALFVGLGSQYAPRLDQLKKHRRLLLHEGPTDLDILKAWAKQMGISWPGNLVTWKYTGDRKAREALFAGLREEIPFLKCLSLQDRDSYEIKSVKQNLTFDDLAAFRNDLGLRMWRRRNIENYLMCPAAIARAAARPAPEVEQFFGAHGLSIPIGADWTRWNCPNALLLDDGKKILLTGGGNTVAQRFGVRPVHVAEAMTAAEIPDDVKIFLHELESLCRA